MTATKHVLAAADGPELVGRVEELLLASGQATIEQTADGASALALARRRRFELLLTEYPLPDLEMESFLSRLREEGSTSRDTAVVVLSGSLDRDALADLGPERLEGVELCVNNNEVLRAVDDSLQLGDRVAARLRVRFDGGTEVFCGWQSVTSRDISPTGILLGAEHLLPVGMVAPIAIELSTDEPLVHGHAEVVRHTDPEREEIVGMGMRFVRLFEDGCERLTEFVEMESWARSSFFPTRGA